MKLTSVSAAALALVLTAGSALAADLPSRKGPPMLPPPPPPPMWTGFYVGLNAGYTFGNSNSITTGAFPTFGNAGLGCGLIGQCPSSAALSANSVISANNDGFIGGGQIGYNWQFYNNFLVGVEADIQGIATTGNLGSAVGNSGPVAGFPANSYTTFTTASRRMDYLGTVRGRLGWLFTPTLLVYGTGGLAYGGVSANVATTSVTNGPAFVINPFFGGASFADTLVGWTAGGGVEWMFWPNWSAKVEYLYYDLGNVTMASGATQLNGASIPFVSYATQSTARFDGHIVRAGLNYHFNWGSAPVVAKY